MSSPAGRAGARTCFTCRRARPSGCGRSGPIAPAAARPRSRSRRRTTLAAWVAVSGFCTANRAFDDLQRPRTTRSPIAPGVRSPASWRARLHRPERRPRHPLRKTPHSHRRPSGARQCTLVEESAQRAPCALLRRFVRGEHGDQTTQDPEMPKPATGAGHEHLGDAEGNSIRSRKSEFPQHRPVSQEPISCRGDGCAQALPW